MIESLQQAVEIVKRWLRNRFPNAVVREYYQNYDRHCLLSVEEGERIVKRIYVVFQREPFHRFCSYFPDACSDGVRREAITLNWSIIVGLSEAGVTEILHILGDGRVVRTRLSDWLYRSFCRYPKHEPVTRVCHIPIDAARSRSTDVERSEVPRESPELYMRIPIVAETIERLARIFEREKPRDEVEAYWIAARHQDDLPAPINYTIVSIAFRRYLTRSLSGK